MTHTNEIQAYTHRDYQYNQFGRVVGTDERTGYCLVQRRDGEVSQRFYATREQAERAALGWVPDTESRMHEYRGSQIWN